MHCCCSETIIRGTVHGNSDTLTLFLQSTQRSYIHDTVEIMANIDGTTKFALVLNQNEANWKLKMQILEFSKMKEEGRTCEIIHGSETGEGNFNNLQIYCKALCDGISCSQSLNECIQTTGNCDINTGSCNFS